MTKNGELSQKGCARHHIVPEFDDKIRENEGIRQNLKSCGIDINDAINGVNLPYKDDADCKGARHGPLHTKEYYYAILRTITKGFTDAGCDGTRDALREIKEDLINNRLNNNGYN